MSESKPQGGKTFTGAFAVAFLFALIGGWFLIQRFVYGLGAVRMHPLLAVGVVVALMTLLYCDPVVMVSLVGLFDTWGDFRRKIDAVVTAHRLREDSDDKDAD